MGKTNTPISLFSHAATSLGFPFGEHGPRSEGKVTAHKGQSPGHREDGRVENEPRVAKSVSGTASKLDLGSVWRKETYRKRELLLNNYVHVSPCHSITVNVV